MTEEESVKEFGELFPSLIAQSRDKNVFGGWKAYYYIHLLEEGGMDDSSGNAKTISDADYVNIESVKEHCTDNQRLKEAITKIKDRLNGSDGLDMLEEEMGLDN